jgi:glycosyltransferase involved in cell wall biosynthesis
MSQPLISVIMPVLNGERYIGAALRSLLRENSLLLDIIVVDDGSTDNTAGIVRQIGIANPGIRLISGRHAGVSKARNTGLAAVPASAEYITFLDSDDLNVPGRISRQLSLMASSKEIDCVIGLMQLFEAANEESCTALAGSRTMTLRSVQLAAALFRKNVFDRLGGFNEEMQHGEDTDFFLRMLEAGINYIAEDELAVMYRRHSDNMTNDIAKTRRGFIDAIRRSLARRRASGTVADLGDLFKTRSEAEEAFRND